MMEQANGIPQAGQAPGRKVPVLPKLTTGGDRFGVRPGEHPLTMAQQLCRLPGIAFEGVYAHVSVGASPRRVRACTIRNRTSGLRTGFISGTGWKSCPTLRRW